MALSSYESAGSPRSIGDLVANQRPGYSFDRPLYTDRSVYEFEMERIFRRRWLFVDHVARIPRPGDFILRDIAGDSIIVIRDHEARVRAFYNVCRHCGSRLCTQDKGRVKHLACPYHGWTYTLDGRLANARLMPPDFDPSAHGLNACHLRVVEGLIFISLCAGDPPEFDEMVAPFLPFLDFHGVASAKIAHREVFTVAGNWKLVVENNLECYHCIRAHPEYASVASSDYMLNFGGGPDSGPQDAIRDFQSKLTAWEEHVKALGHPVGSFVDAATSNHFRAASRAPILEGLLSMTKGGEAAAPLMGKLRHYDGGRTALTFDPLTLLLLFNDYAIIMNFMPKSEGQSETVLTWLVDPNAREGEDYNREHLTWLYDVTLRQDKTIIENNQAGVCSSAYRPGPYSTQEAAVVRFHQWYCSQMKSEVEPGPGRLNACLPEAHLSN